VVRHVPNVLEQDKLSAGQDRRQRPCVDLRRDHRVAVAGDNDSRNAQIAVARHLRGNEILQQREGSRAFE